MKATCLCLLSAVFINLASAEESASAHEKAATALVEVMDIKKEMETGFSTSIEPMMQPMVMQMGLNEEQTKELKGIFMNWWQEDIDQDAIVAQFRALYMESFSTEELEELTAFYATPLGSKVLTLMPELTQRGMEIGMEAAGEKEAALTTRIDAFMEKVMDEQEAEAPSEPGESPSE